MSTYFNAFTSSVKAKIDYIQKKYSQLTPKQKLGVWLGVTTAGAAIYCRAEISGYVRDFFDIRGGDGKPRGGAGQKADPKFEFKAIADFENCTSSKKTQREFGKAFEELKKYCLNVDEDTRCSDWMNEYQESKCFEKYFTKLGVDEKRELWIENLNILSDEIGDDKYANLDKLVERFFSQKESMTNEEFGNATLELFRQLRREENDSCRHNPTCQYNDKGYAPKHRKGCNYLLSHNFILRDEEEKSEISTKVRNFIVNGMSEKQQLELLDIFLSTEMHDEDFKLAQDIIAKGSFLKDNPFKLLDAFGKYSCLQDELTTRLFAKYLENRAFDAHLLLDAQDDWQQRRYLEFWNQRDRSRAEMQKESRSSCRQNDFPCMSIWSSFMDKDGNEIIDGGEKVGFEAKYSGILDKANAAKFRHAVLPFVQNAIANNNQQFAKAIIDKCSFEKWTKDELDMLWVYIKKGILEIPKDKYTERNLAVEAFLVRKEFYRSYRKEGEKNGIIDRLHTRFVPYTEKWTYHAVSDPKKEDPYTITYHVHPNGVLELMEKIWGMGMTGVVEEYKKSPYFFLLPDEMKVRLFTIVERAKHEAEKLAKKAAKAAADAAIAALEKAREASMNSGNTPSKVDA